jgi:hypothetical protein
MDSKPRARYTLEFKLEAIRLVKAGQSAAGGSGQTWHCESKHQRLSPAPAQRGNQQAQHSCGWRQANQQRCATDPHQSHPRAGQRRIWLAAHMQRVAGAGHPRWQRAREKAP